jgi:putative restriction endonuclease
LAKVNKIAVLKRLFSPTIRSQSPTGINQPELLVASHILRWSEDVGNRLNPRNGLALNSLHDNAFERGFITVTEDLKLKVSSILLNSTIPSIKDNFTAFDGKELIAPKKFSPEPAFLRIHNDRFKP